MIGASFQGVLAGAVDGDEQCFAVIWRDLQPALLRYLRVVARGAGDDIASETWLDVVQTIGRFKGDEPGFRAWVFTIARHRALDWQRRSIRQHAAPVPADLLAHHAADDDPAAAALETLSTEAALALLAGLPQAQAEVVLLRVVAGLAVAQVLAVAAAPPRPEELAGEAEALALFSKHAPARAVRAGRRLARLTVVAAVLLGLVSVGGIGFATGLLPRTGQWLNRTVQSVVGTTPASDAPPGTEPGSSSSTLLGGGGGPAAPGTTPGSVQSPSSSAVPGSTAAAEELCKAWQAGNGTDMDPAASQALAAADGGSGNIPAYCRAVKEGQGQGGSPKPGNGNGNGQGNGNGNGNGQGGGGGQGLGDSQTTPGANGQTTPGANG